MDIQEIIKKIMDDARQMAAQTLSDAHQRAQELRTASDARLEKQQAESLARAKAEGVEMVSRMERMAELEDKKALLAAKRQVLDEVFSVALQQLKSQSADKTRAFMQEQLLLAAQGDETLAIGAENNAWFDAGFLQQANEALAKQGKQAALTLSPSSVPGCGFVLQRGGAAQGCTYEALLSAERLQMEAEIARILFAK